jgi:hypothetical protein
MANSGPNSDSDLPPHVCHGESQILDLRARTLYQAASTEECWITAPIYAGTPGQLPNDRTPAPMNDMQRFLATEQRVIQEMRGFGPLLPPA